MFSFEMLLYVFGILFNFSIFLNVCIYIVFIELCLYSIYSFSYFFLFVSRFG